MSNVVRIPDPSIRSEKREQDDGGDRIRADQASLLTLFADVLEANTSASALDALAASLQLNLECQRVAIALTEGDELTLRAISQQAFIDPSSSESKLIVAALQEACDHEAVVRWPNVTPGSQRELGVLIAHRALAGRRRSTAYCSVPLYHNQLCIGAILVERRDSFTFTEEQGEFLEKMAVVIAPLLFLHIRADRGIYAVGRERLKNHCSALLGIENPGRGVLVGFMAFFLLSAFFIPVESSISTSAELLPLERRLVTAPRTGFVQSVSVVAGDEVKAGQLLASLDARELELEASRSKSEILTAEVEFRAAMASFDRQASAVARSRLAQIRAQQMLVDRQLEQSQLRAPIAGLVLNADSSESLGAPISRGDTLFEIAPADGYEVHLFVDEADIREIYVGQSGELSLRARPKDILSVAVQSIHPIAETGNGMSRFRVRASLEQTGSGETIVLRPGESGRAKLAAGSRSLYNLLFDPLWQKLSMLKWRWFG